MARLRSWAMPAKICDHCGQDIPEMASRFGLVVQKSPPKIMYGTRTLRPVSPVLTHMLWLLCLHGRASNEALADREGAPISHDSVKVHMVRLRDYFALEAVLIKVTAVTGWGYLLQPCPPDELTEYRARPSILKHADRARKNKGLRINGANAAILASVLDQIDVMSSEAARPSIDLLLKRETT